MGHDLGHTPFGHAGEKVLAKLMPDGFHHVKQSLRVVEMLERDGQGLNLSVEVRDGILKHSKGKGHIISDNPNLMAMTLEGQIVRISDIVAYVNHDLDDAVRGRVVDPATRAARDPRRARRHARRADRAHGRRHGVGVAARGEAPDPDDRRGAGRADRAARLPLRDGLRAARDPRRVREGAADHHASCGATSTPTPTSSAPSTGPREFPNPTGCRAPSPTSSPA